VDETVVFQAIRDAVTDLQTALHRKVSTILTDRTGYKVAGPDYESTWLVTVKYWLDYARPDDVPYLKGMQRCLAESRAAATKEWLAWAEAQVGRKRAEFAEQIAFQQELAMHVVVRASLDATGKIIASTLKIFDADSGSDALSISAETLATPSAKQWEQAGYDLLKARLTSGSPSSGGSPATGQTEGQAQGQSGGGSTAKPPVQPSSTQSPWVTQNPNQRILTVGIVVLAGLMLLLVLNQYFVRRRRR
jgi:hypothetical protein